MSPIIRKILTPLLLVASLIVLAWNYQALVGSDQSVNRDDTIQDSVYIVSNVRIAEAYRMMNMDALSNARAFVESHLARHREDYLLLYYRALADYHIGFIHYLRTETRQKASPYFDSAIAFLEESVKRNSAFVETHILLTSVLGFTIGLKPDEAQSLGMKSENHLAKAKQMAPTNPRLVLVDGISTLYKPASYGGGREAAIEKLKDALRLWKTHREPSPTLPDWGCDDTYAWIIRVYLSAEQLVEAEHYIREALTVNPENYYVREVLLPRLETRQKARRD
ncbi:MAG: hypothetical protein FJ215_10745 [Ignavibacteria bacterium]|nr:hypothetical protein [Ignavibacteria bacterium]